MNVMNFKCRECDELLDTISFPGNVFPVINHEEQASMYACTSADCKNAGLVIVVGHEPKEEDEII